VIEEGSIPGAIGSVMPEVLAGAAALAGEDLSKSAAERVAGLLGRPRASFWDRTAEPPSGARSTSS